MVVTIVTIWSESENAQSSKEPGYSRFVGAVSKRRRILVGWWSSRRSSHGRRSWRVIGNEIWWVFYHPIRRSRSSFALWRRQGCNTIIQIRIPLFKQHGRIWSLSNQASHDPRNRSQAFKSNGWFEPSGLLDQREFLLKGTQPSPVQSNGPEDGGKFFNLWNRTYSKEWKPICGHVGPIRLRNNFRKG